MESYQASENFAIGHRTLYNKGSNFLISVVAVLHSHISTISTLNTQQRPPSFPDFYDISTRVAINTPQKPLNKLLLKKAGLIL